MTDVREPGVDTDPANAAAEPGDAFGLSVDGPHSVLGGRVTLWQPTRGYRTAIDAVLLAAAVPAESGARVLDLGMGVGAAALCLAARVDGVTVDGLEIQPELARLAQRNAAASGLAGWVTAHCGDIAAAPAHLAAGSYPFVTMNPPFAEPGEGRPPQDPSRRISFVTQGGGLDLWIAAARRFLRPRGWLIAIHRADRLDRLMAALRPHFGGIVTIPIWPRAGVPAKRVILAARLGVATPATLHPGLVLHTADGAWTPQAAAILQDAAALSFRTDGTFNPPPASPQPETRRPGPVPRPSDG